MYLTICTQEVLVLLTEPVHHINDVGYTPMMQPEPAFLPPRVSLGKSCTLPQAGQHAKYPPGACLA